VETITPSLCIPMLCAMVEDRAPVLLVGPPGVGKTDITHQVKAITGYDMIVSHPVVMDPTDVKGLGFADWEKLVAKFLPFGDLHRALNAKVPTIWFLDDLGQAPAMVQAAFMQLILARRIGEHELPDCITFVAATNRRQDRAGVKEFLNPLKSRMVTILHVAPCVEDWCEWAWKSGQPATLIALIRSKGLDMLFDENNSPEIENTRSPRTWANAGRVLKNEGYTKHIPKDKEIFVYKAGDDGKAVRTKVNARRQALELALNGAVGRIGKTELLAYHDFASKLPDPNAALANPMGVNLPDMPDVLWVFAMTMARMVEAATFGSFLKLVARVRNEAGRDEIAALMLQDALAVKRELQEQPEFVSQVANEDAELHDLIG
jgi:AAA domain (dynein-related subfamily)